GARGLRLRALQPRPHPRAVDRLPEPLPVLPQLRTVQPGARRRGGGEGVGIPSEVHSANSIRRRPGGNRFRARARGSSRKVLIALSTKARVVRASRTSPLGDLWLSSLRSRTQ